MKCFHKKLGARYWALPALIIASVFALRAELPNWAQETIAFTPLEAALFRIMMLPDGTVMHLRPPWEGRDHITNLIAQTPHNAELYSIRAREEERLQQYTAAETDWKQAAAESKDKLACLTELAEFYRRRTDAPKAVASFLQLAAIPQQADQRFVAPAEQPQWSGFIRAKGLADSALLPASVHTQIFEEWTRRYPRQTEPYQEYLKWSVGQGNRREATAIASRMKAAFPRDVQLAIETDADLARVGNGADAALAVYAKNFSPLWPASLQTEYFQALTTSHQLRSFLGEAQTAAAADPTALAPALRLFFYYEQENRKDVADQQILNLLSRRATRNTQWTATELRTAAELLLRVADYDESAQTYYMLYQLPSSGPADKELALSSLISLLLDVPEQPLRFGNRDLSLYRNIAQMDRHPGFLNGILSLVLNESNPEYQFQNASQTAVTYFHRASASVLIDKLKTQFPRAPQTPSLEAKLFNAYATYGQQDAIIRAVPSWMDRNRNAGDYVSTALLLADAYGARQNSKAELSLYDRLLTELGNKSDHMPIGQAGVLVPAVTAVPVAFQRNGRRFPPQAAAAETRSSGRLPDYSRVLDRYISRLVELKRGVDAVALFRREIDRNPDDPGIYERFALFLEQNRLDTDVEQTYRDAFNHFKDTSWASKLGRLYLRHEQHDAYAALAHQITDTFKGSELAMFLLDVGPTSPMLYRQVNLYAHQRFPYNLTFVHNLLTAYSTRPTADSAAYEKLLRENWFNDSDLRNRFFEHLSSSGKLRGELASLPSVDAAVKDSNLASLEFRAGGQSWVTQFEAAAPVLVRISSLTPGDTVANARAISVERSLASSSKGAFETAVRLAEQDVNAAPDNREAVTRVGEIYADRDEYSRAKPWWNRVHAAQPGESSPYLESATVFWDYFQFNDALRVISEARQKLKQPTLFAYETGAIYENQNNLKAAVDSYIDGALHEGSAEAKARLIRLARRKNSGPLVEAETARLTAGAFDANSFELRLSLLEAQSRRSEIQAMLSSSLGRATRTSEVSEIDSVATRLGFDDIAAQSLRQIVAMSNDPIEKLQARINLARFNETHNGASAAESEFASLLRDEPNRLGVVRAATDFYWRQKQAQAAVSTLDAAANRAQAPYQTQLRREAAEKATNSAQYAEARRLLDQLLATDPYNGDLLAEKAATFAKENDNKGLADFYAAELKTIQTASLPAGEKATRLAALRRGYILALSSLGQFTDALEQYQLVVNAYPEDVSLASEAARFADSHQLAARITAYYTKATADSPHDYRWPLVLAHIQTSLRQYSEAIASFDKAAYVRPDRSDLFLAKADLETRLLRFKDALKSYAKLYELSFHDVQYLGTQAELNARLGNGTEARRLLRAAYVEPHPNEPGGYVTAMHKAAEWRMYDHVDALFKELRPKLDASSPWRQESLTLESEALIAQHHPLEALTVVSSLVGKSQEIPPYETAIGAAIQRYLTPAEKAEFAGRITQAGALPAPFEVRGIAHAAGLREIEAAELLKEAENAGGNNWITLEQLQSSRLQFEALGNELEAIAKAEPFAIETPQILAAAFRAYESAGDTASQLRLVDHAGGQFARLFTEQGGDLNGRLSTLSGQRANQVVQYLITNGPVATAVSAISVRGKQLQLLWVNSYTALTGLYTLSAADWATQAFDTVLGSRTVGIQLKGDDALKGDNWFYYAARYGDYLGYFKKAEAQDYLPATLEANPVASNSYVELASTFDDLKQPARAAELYGDALQLSPGRADVYDDLALLALEGNHRSEAIAAWRHALEILAARVEKGPLKPDYWVAARTVLAHINRAHVTAELKGAADTMLRTYAHRNGTYQFEPFLSGIFDQAPDKHAALLWVIELSRMPSMDGLVGEVLYSDEQWINEADKDALYRAEIDRARTAANSLAGQAAVEARAEITRKVIDYARYLYGQKRFADEWGLLAQISPQSDVPADVLLTAGALTGHLNDLFNSYRAKPESAPEAEQILNAAAELTNGGHRETALALEEFEYGRELEKGSAPASSWFGLARVRLEQKRNDEALSLIRNVTIGVGQAFENLPEAVSLLEKQGFTKDAEQYALEWKTAEPWNGNAQLALARLKGDPKMINAVRVDPSAAYALRVAAARTMRDLRSPVAGNDELALLTHRSITAEEAAQPMSVEARLDAAKGSQNMAERRKLYEEAIALEPTIREARLDLAQAAFATRNDALALAAFNSYRNGGNAYGTQYNADADGGYGDNGSPNARFSPRMRSGSEPKNFAAAEEAAAQAYTRRGQWGLATNLYGDLLRRTDEPAKRNAYRQARDSAKRSQTLQLANLRRRPTVTDEITQRTVVKPKLTRLPPSFVTAEEEQPNEEAPVVQEP